MKPQAAHVLVVEDEADAMEALAEVLWQAGYRVSTADDGREALELLREHGNLPHVLLTDLMMPVLDGWELARQMALDPVLRAIPIVVMTASGPSAVAAVQGVVGYVPKPVAIEQLLAVLARTTAPLLRTPRWKSGAHARARVIAPDDGPVSSAPRSSRPPRARSSR